MHSWKFFIIGFPAWLQPLRAQLITAGALPAALVGQGGACRLQRKGRPVGSLATAADSGQRPSQDKRFAPSQVGKQRKEALSAPPASLSHICSPQGCGLMTTNGHSGREEGLKTPGEKPFALGPWDGVIISTEATRSRRWQQEASQHVCKNRTSVDSVLRCCPQLCLLRHLVPLPRCSPPKPEGKPEPQMPSPRTVETHRRRVSSNKRRRLERGTEGTSDSAPGLVITMRNEIGICAFWKLALKTSGEPPEGKRQDLLGSLDPGHDPWLKAATERLELVTPQRASGTGI